MARFVLLICMICMPVLTHAEQAKTGSARQHSLEQAWMDDLQPTKVKSYVSPVKRVTNLLSKMKAELEQEADKEAEMYDKMVCWCEQNQKEKTRAVADADAKDRELVAQVESRSARFGELSSSIENMKKEIAENTEALNEATAIREKEAAKFRGEETDMVQIITNLRNAIAVLSKHQTTQALLQIEGPVLSGLRVLLRDAAVKYEELVAGREERGVEHMAFLSLRETTQRLQGADSQGIDAALMSALDLHGQAVSDSLPLKFAAQLVAKAARAARPARSQGGKFLQVEQAQPLYESRSSARSATIYGIMSQMLEEFEAELSTAQKDELRAQANYKALAAAKTKQIESGQKNLDDMQAEDASNQKALTDAKEDLALTREQRTADVEFLQNLQTTCNDLDTQWEKRSQTRAAETKAVAEAIAILIEDDNRELLTKTVTLLQEQASRSSKGRSEAVSVLRHAAATPSFDADDLLAAWHGRGSPTVGAAAGPRAQLSTLAMAVQLDSFTKVKKMMDKMLVNLKQEQEDEVEFKAYCVKEFDTTEKTTYDKNELKNDLEQKIQELAKLIENLQAQIADHKSEVANTELEIKKASQTRESENAEFQTVVADQRATQSILTKALQKLKDFYVKKIGKVALAQRSTQEPPVKFNKYTVHAGFSPVIGLLEQIIGDSKTLEAETTSAEFEAQADYEKFVKDSNDIIKNLEAAITARTKATAAARGESAEADSDLQNTNDELDSLAEFTADLHNQCDFVLKNFDIRQKARLQEMEAIQAAKAILSGEK